jgi:hypothetical protein
MYLMIQIWRWKFGWFCQELCFARDYGINCKFHSENLNIHQALDFFCRDTICICTYSQKCSCCLHFRIKSSKNAPNLGAPRVSNWPSFIGTSKRVFAYSALLMLNNSRHETWSRLPKSVTHKVVVHITLSSENYNRDFALRGLQKIPIYR